MFSHVIMHVPHSSAFIPPEYEKSFLTDVGEELSYMTDWYTDELFSSRHESLVFPVSRLICDVERFRRDSDEIMAERGMGAVYERGHRLQKLRRLGENEREEILEKYYDPHHRTLEEKVRQRLEAFGKCLIIDCHSFYPEALPYELGKGGERPDICIGTDPFHTPESAAKRLEAHFRKAGYSVGRNSPFAGALVPMRFYGKDSGVSSVMIELNRKLYLNGREKSGGFEKLRDTLLSADWQKLI